MPVHLIDLVIELLRVLGDQPQRILLATTADQDRWAPNRLRLTDAVPRT